MNAWNKYRRDMAARTFDMRERQGIRQPDYRRRHMWHVARLILAGACTVAALGAVNTDAWTSTLLIIAALGLWGPWRAGQ